MLRNRYAKIFIKEIIVKQFTYLELLDEIERVIIAFVTLKSDHWKNDYKKYLRKPYKEMHNYERFRGWKNDHL